MQREEYEKLIETRNGKKCWTRDAEENIFGKDLNEATSLVKRYPSQILFFSRLFMSANPVVVETSIECMLEKMKNDFSEEGCKGVKLVLEAIPYEVLKEHYNVIFKYVQKNGDLLSCVPERLQEEYLHIPMEAVRNTPHAVKYASQKALRSYPDIAIFAVKADSRLAKV